MAKEALSLMHRVRTLNGFHWHPEGVIARHVR